MGLIDKTKHEEAALDVASQRAGEYIESLPSSDMRSWTRRQWRDLLEVIVAGFTETMGELSSREAPF